MLRYFPAHQSLQVPNVPKGSNNWINQIQQQIEKEIETIRKTLDRQKYSLESILRLWQFDFLTDHIIGNQINQRNICAQCREARWGLHSDATKLAWAIAMLPILRSNSSYRWQILYEWEKVDVIAED